jgi:hypothetical protein
MMRTSIGTAIGMIAVVAVAPLTAQAFVIGGSNLPMFGYPAPACTKPMSKPIKPYEFSDEGAVDEYNSEVDEYNSRLSTYTSCIREYVDNANNDIKRIREKAQEAIDEANSQ